MGGDDAPAVVIQGADIARERYPQARFLLFGREPGIKPLLEARPALVRVSEIVHTDGVVDRRGARQIGRCRGLGRQYRRIDGPGQVLPAHASGH